MFEAYCSVGGGGSRTVGNFCTAEEAARAYDDAVRKVGRCVVNFPRPGADEVQAVKGEKEEVTLQRASGKRAPPRRDPLPPDPGYKGVSVNASARTGAVFAAVFKEGGVQKCLGNFCTAEEAARAYDDAVRKTRHRVVNFPRSGTDEVQAVKGEMDKVTLARHAAAQQAGGAGAAGGITPPSMASSLSKRRAAAPAPLEPPRKHASGSSVKPESPAAPPPAPFTRRPPHRIERESSLPPGFVAPAAGIKTESPAAVKPEAPVAPPHVPYTASTGRPLQAAFAAAQAALAASLPPDDGPGLPASGIKPETPPAPPMAAVAASGWASPVPPSASAAAAPPVKMELD